MGDKLMMIKFTEKNKTVAILALTLLAIGLGCVSQTNLTPTKSTTFPTKTNIPKTIKEPGGAGTPIAADMAVSNKSRQTSPQAPDADLKILAGDNNAFALDLYHAFSGKTPQNLVFSPYSISQALAMTYAGANGKTASQMAQVLHFTLPSQRLHPAFNALDLSLQNLSTAANPDQFQLKIANSLWGQTGYPYLSPFLDLLAENYGTGMYLTDYSKASESSRQTINQWVSQQTENKINDLLAQGVITPNTRLTLVNAIYFYAHWDTLFNPNYTHQDYFTRLDGSKTSASFMSLGKALTMPYIHGADYQAVELPYKGDQVVMTLIVPDSGHFSNVQKSISVLWLNDCWAQMQDKKVNVVLPKFKFETSLGLNEVLAGMGMSDAINNAAADFSGMDGNRDLYIGAVVHKALIAVDEDGTQAAAASAPEMQGTTAVDPSIKTDDINLIIDRPFFFVIHDTQNHSILFMGQGVDPH